MKYNAIVAMIFNIANTLHMWVSRIYAVSAKTQRPNLNLNGQYCHINMKRRNLSSSNHGGSQAVQ